MYLDDEDIYLARMQEVLDGHWLNGSTFFYEYKNEMPLMLPLGEYVYSIPSLALHIPITQILVFYKFLLPAVLFILIYVFSLNILKNDAGDSAVNKFSAVAAGLLVVLMEDFQNIKKVLTLLNSRSSSPDLSIWTRPVNPILGALVVFGFLILTWNLYKKRNRWLIIPSGILLGLSIFYFFSWGICISIIGILLLVACINKNWKMVKDLLLTIALSFLVSAPYWYSVAISMGKGGKELSLKNGMFFTHAPLLNKTLLATLVVYLLLTAVAGFSKRSWKEIIKQDWWQFCLALLLGGLWAMNQQVLTGRTIWPYHFVQYTVPLCFIVLVVACHKLIRQGFLKIWWICMITFAGLSLAHGIVMAKSYSYRLEDFMRIQQYADVYNWINNNTPKDCVVLVKEQGEWLTRQIPAFTHCNVYVSSWMFSGVPKDRIEHNYLVFLRLIGITSENINSYLIEHQSEVRGYTFEDWNQLFNKNIDPWLLAKIDGIIKEYQVFVNSDFRVELRKYKLDYIISEEPLKPEELKDVGLKNEAIYSGKVKIYELSN